MKVVIAVDGFAGEELAERLRLDGVEVGAVVGRTAPSAATADALSAPEAAELLAVLGRADVLLLEGRPDALSAELIAACDRFAVRIIALCERTSDARRAASVGIDVRSIDDPVANLLSAAPARDDPEPTRGRVIAVWGPHGAPGRTTVAIEVACALATRSRHVALIDADSHAPSVALATGLADEGPGFAAACRQAERGALTVSELARIAVSVGDVDVLTGLNRPGRWPELSAARVTDALEVSRSWADDVVVDVAASLERDEEIVSDLVDGPRRNAATLACLTAADSVVAVVAADPVGIARFVRAWPDVRAAIGTVPVRVVVNKTRSSVLGIDARGQIRRTLERYAGIGDVSFLPWDPKGVDAAMLAARPVAHAAPRSALATAVRRMVTENLSAQPRAVDPEPRPRALRRLARAG